MSNDYIIAFDETGSPYIAHMGPSVSRGHKYVMKVIADNGKAIYFYTMEAYKQWQKNRQNKKSEYKTTSDNSKPHQRKPDEIPEGWSSDNDDKMVTYNGDVKSDVKNATKVIARSSVNKTEEQLRKELKARLAKKSR